MYHRFEENKYPSTNIKIEDFKKHIEIIRQKKIQFIDPINLEKNLLENKYNRKVLLTIDDAYLSFYENAWPILKKERIPFLLFVSTREVGKFNYMSWEQIKEIAEKSFVHIGNHSHTHEYLIDEKPEDIKKDIKKSITIFKNKLGYNSIFFSYPFGEYSIEFKKIIKNLNFKFAFGQHSGVFDETKDFFEIPRFPINEKYGEINRFKLILNTIPFKFKKIYPEEKYINNNTNPPEVEIEFYESVKNLNQLNCYSNEENKWRKSNIEFVEDYKLKINLQGKFTSERGRINCSLREENGFWRWLGIQFVVAEK
jgi:peptidoglycan/xylan/chitin deacetylase (PgdA/CDA1 family)